MGSFNVSCGMSNLMINEGDTIGFVILGKSRFSGMAPASRGVTYLMRPDMPLKPFLPPLYGSYGGYGNMVDIHASPTAEIIENIFQRPVATVLSCIGSDRGLYDSCGEIYQNYFSVDQSWDTYKNPVAKSLTEIGFKHVETLRDTEVFSYGDYSLIYISDPEWENEYITVGPQSQWIIENSTTGDGMVAGFHHQDLGVVMDRFHRATGLLPGYNKEDHNRVLLLNSLSGMFFLKEVYSGMKSVMEERDYFGSSESLERQWDHFMSEEINDAQLLKLAGASGIIDMQQSICLPGEFRSELVRYYANYEVLEAHYLTEVMHSINRVFTPTVCGPEEGNNDLARHLLSISSSILGPGAVYDGYDEEDLDWDYENEELV